MTTFTTRITAMYTLQQPDPNYVVNALWEVTGVDGEYTGSIGGNTHNSVLLTKKVLLCHTTSLLKALSLAGFQPRKLVAHRRVSKARLPP